MCVLPALSRGPVTASRIKPLCALAAEWGSLLHLQRRRRMGEVWGSERDQQDRAHLWL